MKRKLALALGLTGLGIAVGGLLRRRRPVAPAVPPDRRAEDLRRRLAERRATDPPPRPREPEPRPAVEESVADARRRVHEEGRAAVDEMRRSEEGTPS